METCQAVSRTRFRSYADELVGEDKEITVDGFVLGGADADNYNLTTTEATTTGSIVAGDATASTTTANVSDGTAGEVTTIVVTVKDIHDNPVGKGGANVKAEITGVNPQSVTAMDNGDGTYTITYTPVKSGIDEISITLDGEAISGSPYISNISFGPINELILTSEVINLASGDTDKIIVTLKDAYGNTVTSGAESTLQIAFT